ncbi:hypothetical protein N9W17_01110 [Jannaschia sp.]|nr:hypothetical protein [Jannaschia sp.]
MSKDWIIEVLGDLRGFATMNDLPATAVQLEEAIVVAIAEISQDVPAPARAGTYDAKVERSVGEAR